MLGEIVQATRSHATEMAPRMRAAEVEEVRASDGFTPIQALEKELANSIVAWSWIVDGEVACMFGITTPSMLGGYSFPWMLTTDLVEQHSREFARACKRGLPHLLSTYGVLAGMVDARYKLSVRWLQWLGATVYKPEPYGSEGALFRPFTFGA